MAAPDPFAILGVAASATDAELRAAYLRLVKLHHPDHNQGSPESARRFTEVQEAYARVKLTRSRAQTAAAEPTHAGAASDIDARLAAMERELGDARRRREAAARAAQEAAQRSAQARRAAREAAAQADRREASDEELGYVTTDDSFSKIFDDLADEVTARLREPRAAGETGSGATGARPSTAGSRAHRVADWIDELGSRLTAEGHDRDDRD